MKSHTGQPEPKRAQQQQRHQKQQNRHQKQHKQHPKQQKQNQANVGGDNKSRTKQDDIRRWHMSSSCIQPTKAPGEEWDYPPWKTVKHVIVKW